MPDTSEQAETLPQPVPDLKANCEKGPRVIRGSMPGEHVFGLPVIEVRSIGG